MKPVTDMAQPLPPMDPIIPGEGWRLPHRHGARKMSHILAVGLRRQILAGKLAAGQRLPSEAELFARRCGEDGLSGLVALHDAERAPEGDALAFAT